MNKEVMDKNKYLNLMGKKKNLDLSFRLFWTKKPSISVGKADLLDLSKLSLKGGPNDLSANLDSYLYS